MRKRTVSLSDLSESLAIKRLLAKACEMGISNLIVEGDNKVVWRGVPAKCNDRLGHLICLGEYQLLRTSFLVAIGVGLEGYVIQLQMG